MNYLPIGKLVLAVITASRKLRHYFDAHPIKVLTSHPIKATLGKADFSGRMEKWSVELGRFHIEYEPRIAIKGQVLADFIAEFTGTETVEPTDHILASTGGQEVVMEEADPSETIQPSEQIVTIKETGPSTQQPIPMLGSSLLMVQLQPMGLGLA